MAATSSDYPPSPVGSGHPGRRSIRRRVDPRATIPRTGRPGRHACWNTASICRSSISEQGSPCAGCRTLPAPPSALGYRYVCANDHLLFRRPWLDGLTALAAVIRESGDLTLATTVSLPVIRGPVQLAKTLAAIDVLSDGRRWCAWGQDRQRATTPRGLAFEERWGRFDEALDMLQRLLDGHAELSTEPSTPRVTSFSSRGRRSGHDRRSGSRAGARRRASDASPGTETAGSRRRTTPRPTGYVPASAALPAHCGRRTRRRRRSRTARHDVALRHRRRAEAERCLPTCSRRCSPDRSRRSGRSAPHRPGRDVRRAARGVRKRGRAARLSVAAPRRGGATRSSSSNGLRRSSRGWTGDPLGQAPSRAAARSLHSVSWSSSPTESRIRPGRDAVALPAVACLELGARRRRGSSRSRSPASARSTRPAASPSATSNAIRKEKPG